MTLILHLAAMLGYLAAWGIHLRDFRNPRVRFDGSPPPLLLSFAAACHLAGLIAFALAHRSLPLVGVGPASSTLAFVIALVVLGAALGRETRSAGLFLLPIVLVLLTESVAVGLDPAPRQTAFRGPWFVLHVGAIFGGYALLVLASAAAAMYLFQFRTLKRKEFGSIFRFFPSLETLDRLSAFGLYGGVPLLTIGLVAAWSWTLTYGGRGWEFGNSEVIFGIVTWSAYLLAILTRRSPRGRGPRAASVCAGAFVVALLTFVALRLTLSPSGFFL